VCSFEKVKWLENCNEKIKIFTHVMSRLSWQDIKFCVDLVSSWVRYCVFTILLESFKNTIFPLKICSEKNQDRILTFNL
jgi:hypothetical protein